MFSDYYLLWADESISLNEQKEQRFIDHYFSGTEYHRRGYLEKALNEYLKAKEISPENPSILACLGKLYWQKGEFDKAIKIYEKVLDLDKTKKVEVNTRSTLGIIYMELERYEDAISEFKECLTLDKKSNKEIFYRSSINKCKAALEK
jgi:tetratricopeptide (TPR) repeat protein